MTKSESLPKEIIVDSYQRGATLAHLSKKFGGSVPSVRAIIEASDVAVRKRGRIPIARNKAFAMRARYEQCRNLSTVAQEFGYCVQTVRRAIFRAGGALGSGLPESTENAVVDAYRSNLPVSAVSFFFNCSPHSVRTVLRKKGVKMRNRGRVALAPALTQKLQKLEALSGIATPPEVARTIVLYALKQTDGRTFRRIDRVYGYKGVLLQFRRDQLENNYYIMGNLWRAVYHKIASEESCPRYFGVASADFRLCLSVLSEKDRLCIKEWLSNHPDYIAYPNESAVFKVVEKCKRTINNIVNSKLYFICKYDPAYDREDMVSLLRDTAYKVAIKYDWETKDGVFDLEKALNYTKRSLWNASSLFIKQNTSQEYCRLRNVDSSDRVYQATTVSIDEIEGMYEPSLLPDTSLEFCDVLHKINDPQVTLFFRLEYEHVPEFSTFIFKETGIEENTLHLKNYKLWRNCALRFVGVRSESEKLAFDSALKEQIMLLT